MRSERAASCPFPITCEAIRLTVVSGAAALVTAMLPCVIRAEEGVAAFSMSIDEFRAMSPADQKELLASVFEHRLQHASNIHYEALELKCLAEYDPPTGSVGKVIERLNGSRLRHWVRGNSFKMVTIRGGPDVSEALKTVACGLDAKSGVVRSTAHFKDGRRPSGRIGTKIDRINDSNFYAYWLDGRHTTQNDFLPRYLVEHRAEFSITAPAGESTVRLTVPWYYFSKKEPWGTRMFDLDPQKGFLPVRGKARLDLRQGGKTLWRVDEFSVETSRLVGDVWMPTQLRWVIGGSSGDPRTCNIHDITVSEIEVGTVGTDQLDVPFGAGMVVVDAIEGVAYVVGPNGERTHVEALVGSGAPAPPAAQSQPTWGWGALLLAINLGVLVVAAAVYISRSATRNRGKNSN